MSKIISFEDLIVWQKAIQLSVTVYSISGKFPKEEIFGLTSQIRKASNSISLNISEGSVKSTKTYIAQLTIALGSASETLSAAILAYHLSFIEMSEVDLIREKVAEITKMLNSLISSLEERVKRGGNRKASPNPQPLTPRH